MPANTVYLLMLLGLQGIDSVPNATIASVISANRVTVKFRDFRNFEDGRLVVRDVTVIGVQSPKLGEAGYKQSLQWAKSRFNVGSPASGTYYPLGNGRFLGDMRFESKDGKETIEVTAEVLAKGMGRFDETLVPKRIIRDPGYPIVKGVWLKCQAEAKAKKLGLWGTVWAKKR